MENKLEETIKYQIINREVNETFMCDMNALLYEVTFKIDDGRILYCFSDEISGCYVIKNHSMIDSFVNGEIDAEESNNGTIEEIQSIKEVDKSKYKMLFIETLNYKNEMDELSNELFSKKKKSIYEKSDDLVDKINIQAYLNHDLTIDVESFLNEYKKIYYGHDDYKLMYIKLMTDLSGTDLNYSSAIRSYQIFKKVKEYFNELSNKKPIFEDEHNDEIWKELQIKNKHRVFLLDPETCYGNLLLLSYRCINAFKDIKDMLTYKNELIEIIHETLFDLLAFDKKAFFHQLITDMEYLKFGETNICDASLINDEMIKDAFIEAKKDDDFIGCLSPSLNYFVETLFTIKLFIESNKLQDELSTLYTRIKEFNNFYKS